MSAESLVERLTVMSADIARIAASGIDLAARRAPLLGALIVAAVAVGIVAACAQRATRRSTFATRATALNACVLLLLVFSLAYLLPRPAIDGQADGIASPGGPTWIFGPRVGTPRVIERALVAGSNVSRTRMLAGVAVLLWMAGAAVMGARVLRGAAQLTAIRRRARANLAIAARANDWWDAAHRAPPPVLISDEVDIPFVCGVWSPAIVVPATSEMWSATEWQMVLRHESSHIVRGDVLTQWVRQLVLTLHWFNPVAHWLVRRADEACEGACDDAVLLHEADVTRYANAILSFADGEWSYAAAPASSIVGRSGFERRVLAMVDGRRHRRGPARADRIVSRLVGVGGGLVFAIVCPPPVVASAAAPPLLASTAAVPDGAGASTFVIGGDLQLSRAADGHRPGAPRQSPSDTTDALVGLGGALRDVNPIVRDAAVRALMAWRSHASLRRLHRVAENGNDLRRADARAAIAAMETSR